MLILEAEFQGSIVIAIRQHLNSVFAFHHVGEEVSPRSDRKIASDQVIQFNKNRHRYYWIPSWILRCQPSRNSLVLAFSRHVIP